MEADGAGSSGTPKQRLDGDTTVLPEGNAHRAALKEAVFIDAIGEISKLGGHNWS